MSGPPDCLPCPFCGGAPRIRQRVARRSSHCSSTVECAVCLVGVSVEAQYHPVEWCTDAAAAKWNRRTELPDALRRGRAFDVRLGTYSPTRKRR